MHEHANVSTIVASHKRDSPALHGIRVIPPGTFTAVLEIPGGENEAKPCRPSFLTISPHTLLFFSHDWQPNRKATAILTACYLIANLIDLPPL